MSIEHFIQEIEKGLKSPAYLLYAEEQFLLKEALLMAAHTIPETERDFCFDAFDLEETGRTTSFEQMLDAANMAPFMSGRRIVAIENMQRLAKEDTAALSSYLANPSPYSVLILLNKGKIKAQFSDTKNLKKIPLDMLQKDIPLWIKRKARDRGFEITDKAVSRLLDMAGDDIGLLSSELEKLVLINKKRVDIQDIMEVVKESGDYGAFDLVNALRDRKTKRVFKLAKTLQETTDTYGILGAINWHYSRVALNDRGKNRSYYDNVFRLLNEADIRIKTSGGNFPLEYLLVRLLQA